MGRFKMRTWYQQFLNPSDQTNKKATIWKMIPKYDIPKSEQEKLAEEEAKRKAAEAAAKVAAEKAKAEGKTITPVDKPDTPPETKECNVTSGTKVSWNCEVVPEGKWLDTKLFTIGQLEIKASTAIIGTGTLLGVIAIAVAICSYIAYKKRQAIASEFRRASTFIRKSLSGRQEEAAEDPNEKIDVN